MREQCERDGSPLEEGLEFDIEGLRGKYRAERDKRLRAEGSAQYRAPSGELAHFVEDPYVEPGFSREAVTGIAEVVIVGGGFAALSAGAHLRMAGIDDIRIVERAGDVGGTWYWNRYPGIQCDIESYVYLPLLEETGFVPSERYARGPEILEHARRLARHFDLYRGALFQTSVSELRWLEDEDRWLVSTDRNDAIRARYVIQTNGLLDRPKLPGIEGIESFRGHVFHTSRWDFAYTGGDSHGGLTRLADKRVAVIGTGASAIQVVPHVAQHASQLFVVQRTPSSVDERGNAPTKPEWVEGLAPGWHRRRRENFVSLTSGIAQHEDLVGDGWTDAVRNLGGFNATPGELGLAMEIADFRKMNSIRERVDVVVEEADVAASLKPWYRQFCKRPTFNDDYLPAFNRPNVELIDTDGQGIDHFTETGFVFAGHHHEIDCVIFATGFDYGTSYTPSARQKGHPIIGRGKVSLADAWRDGLRTLHGFYSNGFPNLFYMGGSQNAVSFVTTYYLDEQAEHIAAVLGEAAARGATVVEPSPEAEADWVATIRAKDNSIHEFQRDCTPGFYNEEGNVGTVISRVDEMYGPGPIPFYTLIRAWRADGMRGLCFN